MDGFFSVWNDILNHQEQSKFLCSPSPFTFTLPHKVYLHHIMHTNIMFYGIISRKRRSDNGIP